MYFIKAILKKIFTDMKKIFLVEDEQDLRDNIETLLQLRGFEVTSAVDGLEAMKKLETQLPDLIISDIMMPYLDGYELYKRVKQNNKTKFIPFLFLTAKSDLSSIRQGMSLGVDDYITKPFASDDLVNAIKVRIEKSEIINDQIDEIKKSISTYLPHELRTPLVAILGYSQILLTDMDTLDKEEIKQMAERINYGGQRLHNRIEKFIQLTDLDIINNYTNDGSQPCCDVNEEEIKSVIIENIITRERLDYIDIELVPVKVRMQERVFKIIIKELLENAVKFSEPYSPVTVKGKLEKNYFVLEILDSGIGMEKHEIANIGAFKQFNRQTLQKEGNGLGLIFVTKSIENAGGIINIDSVKNKYTSVKVHLPTLKF